MELFSWLNDVVTFIQINLMTLLTAFPILYLLVTGIRRYIKNRQIRIDLSQIYSYSDIKEATNCYIKTRAQEFDPCEKEGIELKNSSPSTKSLVRYFIKEIFENKKNDQKFFLILADSGMGKTTFLMNLYLKYNRKWKLGSKRIVLVPFGFPEFDKVITESVIDNKTTSNTIILLDGLDEYANIAKNYNEKIKDITNRFSSCHAVLITSRTQLFPSEKHEPSKVGVLKFGGKKGEHIFKKMYLSPFTKKDISKYLRKRFPFYKFYLRNEAKKIVSHSENLI